MNTSAFQEIISADSADRADLFLTTARRLGTPLINIDKDFWVCWTLNTLYHRLPNAGPRLLFKGGTSLSKAYGLINRFSEDIDVTVFRDDLGHPASTAEIATLSNKKRKAALEAIATDCSRYITTDLMSSVSEAFAADTGGQERVFRSIVPIRVGRRSLFGIHESMLLIQGKCFGPQPAYRTIV